MRLDVYIPQLQNGETVSFRPKGQSMVPRIHSGELVTVSPDITSIELGDILLCKVHGNVILHLVSAIQGDRIQISNNHGHVNGWTNRTKVYGKVIKVEE